MPKTTVAATPAAPETLNPHAKRQVKMDVAALRALDMNSLASIYSAMRTLFEVAAGLLSQPRFSHNLPARDLLDDLWDFVGGYVDTIAKVAKEATPTDPDEIEHKGKILLANAVLMLDSTAEVGMIAAQIARDRTQAEALTKRRAA